MRQNTVGNLKVIGLAVAAAAIGGLAVFAATGFSGDGKTDLASRIDRKAPPPQRVPVHEVRKAPQSAVEAGARVAKSSKVRIRYFETNARPIAGGGSDAAAVLCPKGYKAISGYFDATGPVVLDGFTIGVSSVRFWDSAVVNLSGSQAAWKAGAVCANHVK